jgi:NAD-dependent dihydropyrimidine dehydrogenase PreA subunit
MKRQIITIDEEKCNGCGICVSACHEGAIGMVDGKARLLREDYCDGLGDCLPTCPTGAITFEEREAMAFNKEEVEKNMGAPVQEPVPCGCPGTQAKALRHDMIAPNPATATVSQNVEEPMSQLSQWPVQIKLVPINAPYFNHANLLIAADCTAFSYGDFHNKFMKNKITLIGCPKLDEGDYAEKFTAILQNNDIKSVTVVRMEVPCCGGIEHAVKTALRDSGKMIPWQVITISTDGQILED